MSIKETENGKPQGFDPVKSEDVYEKAYLK